eukprot:scaffold176539_cov21-Tisochrysis_lutea.AAC.1
MEDGLPMSSGALLGSKALLRSLHTAVLQTCPLLHKNVPVAQLGKTAAMHSANAPKLDEYEAQTLQGYEVPAPMGSRFCLQTRHAAINVQHSTALQTAVMAARLDVRKAC